MVSTSLAPVALGRLESLDHEERSAELTRLKAQLATRGFALIRVCDAHRSAALRSALEASAELEGFRFPPINVDEVLYDEVHREAFRALFATAIDCLRALMPTLAPPRSTEVETRRGASLDAQHPELFSGSPHDPLPLEHPFHPTFFNLFNYDHGALNEHRDRGLVTLIHIAPATPLEGREASALWVEGRGAEGEAEGEAWSNADEAFERANRSLSDPDEHLMVFMLGEDGEEVINTLEQRPDQPKLFAAEHSVRVTPRGDYIERSHYQRDPRSRARYNRRSAAMILKRTLPDTL